MTPLIMLKMMKKYFHNICTERLATFFDFLLDANERNLTRILLNDASTARTTTPKNTKKRLQ